MKKEKEQIPKSRQLIDQFHSLDYLSRQGVLKNWLLTWLDYYDYQAAGNALGKAFQDSQVSINEKKPGQRNYKAIELKNYPKEKLLPHKDEITEAIRAMELMFFYYDSKQEKYTNWETAMYSKVTGNKPRKLSKSMEIARKFIPPEGNERDKEFEKGQLALI